MTDNDNQNDLRRSLVSYRIRVVFVLILSDIITFYSKKEPVAAVEKFIALEVNLLNMPTSELTIQKLRTALQHYIEANGGAFKELSSFPSRYSPRNKVLTKKQDAELSFLFAILSCISANTRLTNDNQSECSIELARASFLHGSAVGLSGVKSVWLTKYHEDSDNHAQRAGAKITKNLNASVEEYIKEQWLVYSSNDYETAEIEIRKLAKEKFPNKNRWGRNIFINIFKANHKNNRI